MNEVVSIVPQWYATCTAPRHEKTAALHLQNRCVENYLATYASARSWNGRRVVIQAPLFPGYIFVRIRSNERMRVLETPGIISIVGFNGQLTPLPDCEIEALRVALQTRNTMPCPFLKEGKRVRITAGPMRGLEGVVLKQTRRLRMVVSIDSIMKSFEVELEAGDLAASTPRKLTPLVERRCA
jgi:transcription antitermination factor NusG